MPALPSPLLPGFHPDPTAVLVDGLYYVVTSTFEYLPGLPIYRSHDLVTWEQIGNVATRPEQLGIEQAASGLGVWAPTLRHHDGRFHLIVIITGSPRGCVVFTAENPAGPWDDGITINGIEGIDPDLAWDDDGQAYVTYSGFVATGPDAGTHHGIQQVRVDLTAGKALEAPRSLWSGTGRQFPEAPHVFRRGEHWYLLIAEGGTERGHAVSIARGPAITGPFEGAPANPILTASGQASRIQCTGHADLVAGPDGGDDVLILLGVRTLGRTAAFSPLGRETFATTVTWQDGWPRPQPLPTVPRTGLFEETFDFAGPAALDDPGWLAIGRAPAQVASLTETPGRLTLHGVAGGMRAFRPSFIGRRQRHLTSTFTATIDASGGAGGLACRYDENIHLSLEARGTTVTATAKLADLEQNWTVQIPAGEVELRIETRLPEPGRNTANDGADRIRLIAAGVCLVELDGRYWSCETAASFTGRVTGVFAAEGTVTVSRFGYYGQEI
ncbi:glycoside hydrolase 43 family protein [Actinoplanes lobatus]|uniref:Beta-xylosidase n=1 Tax=Actinoplanes lobatus TaxID=113568 RepID=A0A7W7HLA4_9ACTN|nr:glycoside hydrolase family 43 protein [Actinoplanes lobatus]MBB4752619.1 beta-xylosidase [Actinoplanes lobatus]GGN93602.1 glycoside hydrolase 43 family protein [Actinoplanes lobatus]GIE44716.1 glycoside hydrolase 43 family protein [Actinoplanes lobatus]